MRKAIVSILTVLAIFAATGATRAEEPKPKADAPKSGLEARQEERGKALVTAITGKDFDKALSILDEMIADKDVTDNDRLACRYAQFHIWAEMKKDGAKAAELAKALVKAKKDNAELLNELAWTILDTADLKNRDLDLALEIAKQAAEVSKNENGAILDTLARAYFEKGDLDKAIEYQSKAVEKCQNDSSLPDEIKTQVKETLDKYQNKKADKIS
jgi:tetratricopeptide (TPR) repeat protein